jgi:hypothetical protein
MAMQKTSFQRDGKEDFRAVIIRELFFLIRGMAEGPRAAFG